MSRRVPARGTRARKGGTRAHTHCVCARELRESRACIGTVSGTTTGEPVCARPTQGITTTSSSSACSRAMLRTLCLTSFERGSTRVRGFSRACRRVSQVPSALRAGAHPICRERRAEKDALERAEEVDLDAPVVRRLPRSRELHSIALLGHAIFRGPRGRSGRSQRI